MTKKRILFVDDDPLIHKLVMAELRSQMNEWEVSSSNNGHEALALMEKVRFDAVVSDIEMPTMTGVELLNQVMKRQPHVIRILHSGQTDKEISFKSIEPSHQYLAKPWGFKQLKVILCRAFVLQDALDNEDVKELVAKLPSLPSLPSLYLKLMDEIQSQEPSPSKVGRIISRDIGMVAKILKLVNSAYFGLSVTISDPVHAVRLLGLDTIRALVLTHGVFSQFVQIDPQCLSLEQLLQHSLGVGMLAKMIAKAEKQDLATDALVAGTLHDTGKLILAQGFPVEYKEVVLEAKEHNIPLWLVEKEAFKTSHAEVGAYLLGIWGLPGSIVEAVALHHEPAKARVGGVRALTALTTVHIANVIEQEEQKQVESSINTSELDSQYLVDIGAGDRVEVWREQWRHALNYIS
ncbi:MAG: response regulator [Gammaproteobacteria bacterium]|nr:response regulator [Gammaproteobacteria bacterium]